MTSNDEKNIQNFEKVKKRLNELEEMYEELKNENINLKNENKFLKEENIKLRNIFDNKIEKNRLSKKATSINTDEKAINKKSSPEKKITLFRSLFKGREDVFANRWESRDTSKSGYSPACANEWKKGICNKPQVKCAACKNRKLLGISNRIIFNHLAGKITVGMYPLLKDETCYFLAIDFDKNSWQEDVIAFMDTCKEIEVPAVLERSRSGNGGHVWIFFDSPVKAQMARRLGTIILSKTIERRYQVGLESYDRLFPNQDTMPKGGFGNLIALPLQKNALQNGNSVFIDENFKEYEDQWNFLSSIRKMRTKEMEVIINKFEKEENLLKIKNTNKDIEELPWMKQTSKNEDQKLITDKLPQSIEIVYSNMIYVPKKELSSKAIYYLMRLAAFQNPEFYKAQAMRLPTFNKPRIIQCAEDYANFIGLPRGCLEEVIEFFEINGVKVEIKYEWYEGGKLDISFIGELRPKQSEAAEKLSTYNTGVLSATTAFGKTVIAAWLIANKKVNTLIIVHTKQLMQQWKERLQTFLDIDAKKIGQIGGGKKNRTGIIDIAIIQSLYYKGNVKEYVEEYGMVIADECHHISAYSFEQVLKQVKAKYVYGLTATPIRKDGHHPIVMMQCGNIRYKVTAKSHVAASSFEHIVIPRYHQLNIKENVENKPSIHSLYKEIIEDEKRNDMIVEDVLEVLKQKRSPIILTERTVHVEYLERRFKEVVKNTIVLRGGLGKKKLKEIKEKMDQISDGEERIIIATGKYVGEGFDDARLDTLFLTMPISWKGTLQQYAGRLHRQYDSKEVVKIFDYVDNNITMLMRMYERRLKGYKAMGYDIKEEL